MTDQDLIAIIECPKNAIKANRKKMIEINRSLRNNISLQSLDGKYQFTMFLRQSTEFYEDFSVGLIWQNPSEVLSNVTRPIILLRCQGPHDGRADIGADLHHDYHVHEFTADDLNCMRLRKPSRKGKAVSFFSFETAISYFIDRCKIKGLGKVIELPNNCELDGQISMEEVIQDASIE